MNINNSRLGFNPNAKQIEYFGYRNYSKKIKKYIRDKCNKMFKPKTSYVKEPEPGVKNEKDKIDKKDRKKKIPLWNHILHICLFFISYFLYFISLERCYDGEDICSNNQFWVARVVITLVISIIINSILFILLIFNKVSPLNLIHFIIIFILFYQYSHETLSDDHGYYNFVGFFSLLWVFILFGINLLNLFAISTINLSLR